MILRLIVLGFAAMLSLESNLVTSGVVCPEMSSSNHTMAAMEGMAETPAQDCNSPKTHETCQSAGPCTVASVASHRIVYLEMRPSAFPKITIGSILTPPSLTKAPELPPPRV